MSMIEKTSIQHRIRLAVWWLVGALLVIFSLDAPSDACVQVLGAAAAAVDVLFAVAVAAFPLVPVVPALRFLSARVSHIYHIDRDQRRA